MKLNFKHLKKITQDDVYTTFKDVRGNEIRVSHKTLSPKMKADLDALPIHMADGGEVQKPKGPAIVKKAAEEVQKGASESGFLGLDQYKKNFMEGLKKPKSMAGGGEAGVDGKDLTDEDIKKLAEQSASPAIASMPAAPDLVAEQAPVASQVPADAVRSPASLAAPPPAASPGVDESAGLAPDRGTVPATGLASGLGLDQSPANPMLATMNQMTDAYAMKKAGLEGEAAAVAKQGQEEAIAANKQAAALQEIQNHYGQQLDQINTNINQAVQEVNSGQIDPDRLWHNRSAVGKIGTVIGIIASGLSGQSDNMALKVLNQEIDRDIDAQKSNLHNKSNALNAMISQAGSVRGGMEMMKSLKMGIAASQMEAAAAKAKDPLAQARLKQASGELMMGQAAYNQRIAATATLNKLMNSVQADPTQTGAVVKAAQALDPERGKDLLGREVPGIGFANTPKDADELKEGAAALGDAQRSIKRLLEISKMSGKSLSPTERAEAESLKMSLIGSTRSSFFGNRFNETELELMKGLIPDVAGITTWTPAAQKKLETLNRSLTDKFSGVAKSKGIKVADTQQMESGKKQQFDAWAKANPSNPKAKEYLKLQGR